MVFVWRVFLFLLGKFDNASEMVSEMDGVKDDEGVERGTCEGRLCSEGVAGGDSHESASIRIISTFS